MKRLVLLCSLLMLISVAFGARRALVIGNSRYDKVTLANPGNDADSVAAYLQQLDFVVWKFKDLNFQDFQAVVDSFTVRVGAADDAVVYFSGHGTNQNGINYLAPAGLNLSLTQNYSKTAYSVPLLAKRLKQARTSLIILETSRLWAEPGGKSGTKSLVVMNSAVPNQAIVSSAAPGLTVANQDAPQSLFTKTLLKHISSSEEGFNAMFSKVRAEVYSVSRTKQQPWISNGLVPDFFFQTKEIKGIWRNVSPAEPEGGGSLNW